MRDCNCKSIDSFPPIANSTRSRFDFSPDHLALFSTRQYIHCEHAQPMIMIAIACERSRGPVKVDEMDGETSCAASCINKPR